MKAVPSESFRYSELWWISHLGLSLRSNPPPRPASGLLPRPSGAGAVRGDTQWEAVSGCGSRSGSSPGLSRCSGPWWLSPLGRGPGRGFPPPREGRFAVTPPEEGHQLVLPRSLPRPAFASSPAPGAGAVRGDSWGKAVPGAGSSSDLSPDTGPWWLSRLGEGLTGRGACPPPLSLARRYPHPPPRPRLRRSSPAPGAGAVRGDIQWKSVSGVALNPVLPRVCPDALDRSGLRTFDVRAPALRPVPYRIRGRGAGSPHKIIPVSPSGGPCMRIPGGNRAMGVCGWCCAA
ncbi:MAG: hypothetical protein BWY88_00920 [Synergistetes bacterium ADurb.Bin520]|nr:MAG: hypothetical protein BWY88_00920 [Synergistetes bacterium ADurb.Bin520]